jgi:NAD(P)-dependent dehydrogenase (short-subunit alcohol dehydrogenase family)
MAWNPVIINIASLLGLQGGRGTAAYAASKAGLLGKPFRSLKPTLMKEHDSNSLLFCEGKSQLMFKFQVSLEL